MNLREYYNFPEDANVNLRYTSFFDEQPDNFPCPSNMRNVFSYQETRYAIKKLNTSNVTNFSYMFNYCSYLTTIPQIDTSNQANLSYMFSNCSNLLTISQIDTSNVTNMSYMFYYCNNLASLPPLNCGSLTTKNTYPLYDYSGYTYLTDIGGFIGMKMTWDDNYGLAKCPNLTYQSCINILNGLYDFVGNGETPTSNQAKLKVHANFINLVGDEISIGTNKGWTITA